ncbi:tonB dependent receptor family protein [Asticcacaulis biprosthecium C19]|uniref:TonB dependent receptor family protein n=1 Tax=Asticcacaulis biprosthecium C19 TaxID=715226 RepID=F4QQQ7_9CAUL|nr:TonB-dependent receptor [Asticcacaulis biprosthecium]EGF90544.1 tonB dependent receptor family protein [Asticcacaulis biprosthecium C19]
MKTLKTKALVAILLATASVLPLIPFVAHAEETATESDTVIVTGRINPDDPAPVRQTRARLSRTPGSVAVVARESYDNSYALGLFDTLKSVSGVFAQKKFGEDGRFSIRGSGIGNSAHNRGSWLAIDGVPVNQADGSGDFQEMDPLSVRYVEVYKGANALRFGGAQLGGAVNYVTPTGLNAGYRSLVRVEGGSFGTLRGHVAYADVLGDYDLYVAATATKADGWRDNSQQEAKRLTVNAGRTFGEDRSIRLILQANDLDQRIAGGLTLDQALNSPTATTAANYPDLKYGRNVVSIRSTVQTDWKLNDNWRLNAGVYAAWKNLIHPISVYIDYNYQNYGAFARFDGQGSLFSRRADVFAGVNYRAGLTDVQNYVNANGSPGAQTGLAAQNASSWDVFGEGRLFVSDELALIAGGSYGWTERNYTNRLNAANNADKSFDWFAPRFGVLWQNEQGYQVFANLTRSVEAPTYGALVQSPLPQFTPVDFQDATTFEVGTRGRSAHLIWDLAVYRAQIDGEMLNFIVSPDIPAASFNAEHTVHQGLEAALDWKMGAVSGWETTLRQTYTWSDFHFDGDKTYGDATLPVIPEHYYRAELAFNRDGWKVAPSVEWVPSEVWVDYANTKQAPGYTVWNLSLSKKVSKSVDVFIDARNLADTRYVSSVNAVTDFTKVAASSQRVFWPGEGPAVFVGIRLTGG